MSTRLPTEVIGDGYTSDFAWELLEELVSIGERSAGHDGEFEGARLVENAFEEIGLREIRVDEFDVPGWWRESSGITLVDRGSRHDADYEIIALPGTPAATLEADLVDVGYGIPGELPDSVDGAIVLARSDNPEDVERWYHRMEKYAAAVDNGAVGFVYRNHVEGQLPPTGEIGDHSRPAPIPAVGVSKEFGEQLARYADDGASVRLEVDCRNEPTTSPNVSGALGPDTDEEVLVTAHVDAHDISQGAKDNGAGTVLVCEIARLLSTVEDELETKVRFVPFGSEEIGLFGAYDWADRHGETVKCVMNIDGAGGSRTPSVRGTDSFESMAAPFERAADRIGVPVEVGSQMTPHSDAWPFAERGIPAVTVGSKREESGRGWGHTHADTLDKLDPRDLRSLAVVYAEAALELADPDVETPRRDRSEIREDLDEHYATELQVAGRWHFEEEEE